MDKNDYVKIGNCKISSSANIQLGSIIGKKFRRYLDGTFEEDFTTVIEDNVYIGFYSLVGNGSIIGENSILDDKSIIESNVQLGVNNLIVYSAQICNEVIIKDNNVIGGFIGERTTIGNNCRIFGSIVHSQREPLNDWDDDGSVEAAPIIYDKVFIGFNSVIAGNVKIGPNSYVCAGSIVTKDIPKGHIAFGINQTKSYQSWKTELKDSKIFKY